MANEKFQFTPTKLRPIVTSSRQVVHDLIQPQDAVEGQKLSSTSSSPSTPEMSSSPVSDRDDQTGPEEASSSVFDLGIFFFSNDSFIISRFFFFYNISLEICAKSNQYFSKKPIWGSSFVDIDRMHDIILSPRP